MAHVVTTEQLHSRKKCSPMWLHVIFFLMTRHMFFMSPEKQKGNTVNMNALKKA